MEADTSQEVNCPVPGFSPSSTRRRLHMHQPDDGVAHLAGADVGDAGGIDSLQTDAFTV